MSCDRRRLSWKALACGLFALVLAAPPVAAQLCTNDQQGPDDEPGQKDLNQFCTNGSCGIGSSLSWNFDDTAWSGMNTGDACLLFDTDADGNANRAVCVTAIGNAMMQPGNPKCYICADDRPTRCTGAVLVPCTSTCTVGLSGDAFPNPPFTTHTMCNGTNCLSQDARVDCCVQPTDDGGALLDVCSYPSQQPNSDPSDCIRRPDQCTTNAQCNDNNPCTVDECVSVMGPDFCRNTPGNAGSVCRASAGVCDAAEVCTGASAECPVNVTAPGGTPCTNDNNICTVDQCGGTVLMGNGVCEHPAGNPGMVCRAGSGDVCDPSETCTGQSATCPSNVVAGPGTTCRTGSGDVCDPDEMCTGNAGQACPADTVRPPTLICRDGSGDACDPIEMCTGVPGASCSPDVVAPPSTICRVGSGDVCDPNETCTGNAGQACPTDVIAPATTVCNAGSGDQCDPDERCTGTPGERCPTDTVTPPGTVCRAGSGDACDPEERCAGVADQACPTDVVASDGTSCNEDDVCTSPDTCQGGECAPGPIAGCKVTGGGQLLAGDFTPWVSFGFNVQKRNGTPPVKGQLELNRHSDPKAAYHSLTITSLKIKEVLCTTTGQPGREATFEGTIRKKGQGGTCAFRTVVEDCGEPGRGNDTFTIDITPLDAFCDEHSRGTLDRGNIQVH